MLRNLASERRLPIAGLVLSRTTEVPFGETEGLPSGVTVATNPTVLRSISRCISAVITVCSRYFSVP